MPDLATISLIVTIAYTIGVVVFRVAGYFRTSQFATSSRAKWLRLLRELDSGFAQFFHSLEFDDGFPGAVVEMLVFLAPVLMFTAGIVAYAEQDFAGFALILTLVPGLGALAVAGLALEAAERLLRRGQKLTRFSRRAVSVLYTLLAGVPLSWGSFAIVTGSTFLSVGYFQAVSDISSAAFWSGLGTLSILLGAASLLYLRNTRMTVENLAYAKYVVEPRGGVYVELARRHTGSDLVGRLSGHLVGIGDSCLIQRDDSYRTSVEWRRIDSIAVRIEPSSATPVN